MSVVPATMMPTLTMVDMLAPFVLIPNMVPQHAPKIDLHQILYKIVTPYVPEAWRQVLHNAGLTQNYPNLVHDLEFGSPFGNPPSIDFTFIPKISCWLKFSQITLQI